MTKFLQGKWIADDAGEYVFTRMPEGCLITVAQMRGWGYLTGIGGAHLSSDEAIEIQKANARLIAHAPEMYRLLNKAHSILYRFTIEKAIDVVDLKTLVKGSAELLARIDGKEAEHE